MKYILCELEQAIVLPDKEEMAAGNPTTEKNKSTRHISCGPRQRNMWLRLERGAGQATL